MRGLVLGLMLLAAPAWAASHAPSLSKLESQIRPVDCSRPAESGGLAGTIICSDPNLRAEERDLYRKFVELMSQFKGQDRETFAAGQLFWYGGAREPCVTSTASGYPSNDVMARCLKDVMDRRLALLERLKADPSLLKSTVADYEFVGVWYLKLFPKQYEGKKIEIPVYLRSDSPVCKNSKASLRGWMVAVDGDEIDAMFESANDPLQYCCERPAYMDWSGVVKLDEKGKPYLYITKN